MRKSVWKNVSNKKLKGRVYKGNYDRLKKNDGKLKKGDRVFVLTSELKNGTTHVIAFESHEAAKSAGWAKAK